MERKKISGHLGNFWTRVTNEGIFGRKMKSEYLGMEAIFRDEE